VDQTIRIAKRSELDKVLKLLESLDLPGDGVEEHLDEFLVAEEAGRVIGAVGLEVYGSVGLLRSLAVEPLEQACVSGSKWNKSATLTEDPSEGRLNKGRLGMRAESPGGFRPSGEDFL
jgi:hypothetical protein